MSDRLDRWVYDHPWPFVFLVGPGLAVGFGRITGSIVVAVLIAVVWTPIAGWNLSRGPGRRKIAQRRGFEP